MLSNAKRAAASKGLDFSITTDYLKSLAPEICPVLGIPLDWRTGHGMSYNDSSPSIDRIDNNKGYVVDNVAIVSLRANRLKGDGTAMEHSAIASYIRSHAK